MNEWMDGWMHNPLITDELYYLPSGDDSGIFLSVILIPFGLKVIMYVYKMLCGGKIMYVW